MAVTGDATPGPHPVLTTPERRRLYAAVRQHPGWTKEALAEVTGLAVHDVGGLLALMLLGQLICLEHEHPDSIPRYRVRGDATTGLPPEEGTDAD
jgi:hypothetical protein